MVRLSALVLVAACLAPLGTADASGPIMSFVYEARYKRERLTFFAGAGPKFGPAGLRMPAPTGYWHSFQTTKGFENGKLRLQLKLTRFRSKDDKSKREAWEYEGLLDVHHRATGEGAPKRAESYATTVKLKGKDTRTKLQLTVTVYLSPHDEAPAGTAAAKEPKPARVPIYTGNTPLKLRSPKDGLRLNWRYLEVKKADKQGFAGRLLFTPPGEQDAAWSFAPTDYRELHHVIAADAEREFHGADSKGGKTAFRRRWSKTGVKVERGQIVLIRHKASKRLFALRFVGLREDGKLHVVYTQLDAR